MKWMAVTTMTLALLSALQGRDDAPGASFGVITGRVVVDETGDSLRNARVSVATAGPGRPVVLTDSAGRFALKVSGSGLRIIATKTGYARRELTAPAAGTPIEIRLKRAAAVSGRVVDPFGDPIVGAHVVAEAPSTSTSNPTPVAATDTDDHGEYRLAGLSAGTFVIAVFTFDATATAQPTAGGTVFQRTRTKMYYPGAEATTDAQAIAVDFGDERSGIDFVVPSDQAGEPPFEILVAAARAPAQDPPPRANAAIRGRVISTDGRPVSRARIRLFPHNSPTVLRSVRSDDDGRFEFAELAPGTFRVAAVKPGYAVAAPNNLVVTGLSFFGFGTAVDLADGETREHVEIRLAELGTIAGRVLDELGDPLEGVNVEILRVRYEAGRRRLVSAAAARLTDDRGRYRLYDLPQGQYVVSATVGAVWSADLPGYTRSYFPGSADPGEAQFVSIGPSHELMGIDFSLARTRTARIAGRLLDAAGEATTGGTLQLKTSLRSSSVVSVPVGARIVPDGTFEFPNVAPGQYVIHAYRGRSNSWTEGEFGVMPVSVNGTDVADLTLQMSSGSAISGRFTFDTDDGLKRPARSEIELSPIPVDLDLSPTSIATAEIHSDWTFELKGINGLRRLQLTRMPRDWALKEIRVNGIDVTDRPLAFGQKTQSLSNAEIVLTDRVNELNGTIVDDHKRPAAGSHLIVFSIDRDRWYPRSRFVREATAGADGSFKMAGLPAGSYYAAAAAHVPTDGEDVWQDSELLDSLLPFATTVTLGDGQKHSLTVRLRAR